MKLPRRFFEPSINRRTAKPMRQFAGAGGAHDPFLFHRTSPSFGQKPLNWRLKVDVILGIWKMRFR
jgi:hypothetical protein